MQTHIPGSFVRSRLVQRVLLMVGCSAWLLSAGCGGGGGGGGGSGTPMAVTLGTVQLTGTLAFASPQLSVLIDGAPAVITGSTWTYTTTQAAATHTYQVELYDGVDLIAQRDLQVSR